MAVAMINGSHRGNGSRGLPSATGVVALMGGVWGLSSNAMCLFSIFGGSTRIAGRHAKFRSALGCFQTSPRADRLLRYPREAPMPFGALVAFPLDWRLRRRARYASCALLDPRSGGARVARAKLTDYMICRTGKGGLANGRFCAVVALV